MPATTTLLAFKALALGMVLTPGPNMIYILDRPRRLSRNNGEPIKPLMASIRTSDQRIVIAIEFTLAKNYTTPTCGVVASGSMSICNNL